MLQEEAQVGRGQEALVQAQCPHERTTGAPDEGRVAAGCILPSSLESGDGPVDTCRHQMLSSFNRCQKVYCRGYAPPSQVSTQANHPLLPVPCSL